MDAIGAIGIARCLTFSGAKNRAIYIPEEGVVENFQTPQLFVEEKIKGTPQPTVSASDDSALQHFYDKLFHLASMMKTESGKKLAEKRVHHMKTYLCQLYDELYW